MHPLGEAYLRKAMLPSIYCPGCGTGTVMNSMLHVIDDLGGIDEFLFVSGIGCSGWLGPTIHGDELHTLHGRALAVATGVALSRPDKHLVVFTGDGDCMGIGGNHFIHAARRNLNVTVILINNMNYGMTGGQTAPLTPHDSVTRTSPYGNSEYPFDAVNLAIGAGATFAARETSAHPRRIIGTVKKALEHPGFAFVDVMCQCPTHAGRNFFGSPEPAVMLNALRENAVAGKGAPLANGQYRIGVLHQDHTRPPFKTRKPSGSIRL